MTEPEFRFKLTIAMVQYERIHKYTPAEVVVTKKIALMLDSVNSINFTPDGPKYMGMFISYTLNPKTELAELGTTSDKFLA